MTPLHLGHRESRIAGIRDTWESRIAGISDTGKSQMPGIPDTGESVNERNLLYIVSLFMLMFIEFFQPWHRLPVTRTPASRDALLSGVHCYSL